MEYTYQLLVSGGKNMKKILILLMVVVCSFSVLFCFSACGDVVPTAWVYLNIDGGFISYTGDMYGVTSEHVYYFASLEDSFNLDNYILSIRFIPRVMGSDDIILDDGSVLSTILVDVSNVVDMKVYIKTNKPSGSPIYASNKSIYLNGQKLTPTTTDIDNDSHLAGFLYQNISLQRGNPNGKINGVINSIEYKV